MGPEAAAFQDERQRTGAEILDFGRIHFNFSMHDRLASGSDNWPLTWADDGHQYTTWGDGGGFGGTNRDGRVSLGVARVEGTATSYRGVNVSDVGGLQGKSYGIASVDGVLWMWVSPRSNVWNWDETRLYRSNDKGRTWTATNVVFDGRRDGIAIPSFVQFGRDYSLAPDGYVYVYATNFYQREWAVQVPGEIVLLRGRRTSLGDPRSWQFFAGLNSQGQPTWSSDSSRRKPVFRDWNGIMHTSAMWNPGLGRFLLTMSHSQASAGNVSIFEANQLWGLWRPVMYEWGWGRPYLEPNTFYWNFSPKWLSPDGRSFAMIFTGMDENDSWNLVLGVFNLTAPMKTGGQWRDAASELIEGLGDGVEGAAGTIDSLLENVDGAAGVTDTTASAETADTIAAAAK
ncbi:MAG TPA: hypothetical protein VIC56_04575 [Gemmatimonadota bacterium]